MNAFGQLELVRESLVAVVNEMRANVIHSSYSSIIYEGHDFSCALLAADGRLIAQSLDDNPIHIFAVPYSATEVLRRFAGDIGDGDIFLHNDPYTGGTHLNDVLMLRPVFHEDALAMFAAVRCHWGDVGGMTPGSLSGRVRDIYQEGLRIIPTRICERGRMNTAFLDLLFENMRLQQERRGDFNTMLGTSQKADEHLQRLFRRFEQDNLLAAVDELLGRSEDVMRRSIAEVPDGVYHAEGYMDSDGHSPDPLIGRLRLTIRGDRLIADFTGSSPQTAGPTNVGPSMAFNAVATTVKALLDPSTAVNHGSFMPIEIVNPPGSFINATLPAPCGAMVECRALLSSLVVSALGQALPDRCVGDLKGGANHVYLSGPRRDGSMFLFYEYPAGGTGATRGFDGNHGTRAYPEGDFNAVWAAEVVEAQCPLEVTHYGIRDGSCGDGEFRGGCGIRRELLVLSDAASLSILTDKCIIPPYGTAGGRSSAGNRFVVVRDGEEIEPSPIPGKVGDFALRRGDVVRIETAGGGGLGDPLERDPARVAADVALALLTPAQGLARYGVAFDGCGEVDSDQTETTRLDMRARRVRVPIGRAEEDVWERSRRRLQIPRALAERLGVGDGDLIELSATASAGPLRAWTRLDDEAEAVSVGAVGLAVLNTAPGGLVEIRAVGACPERQER